MGYDELNSEINTINNTIRGLERQIPVFHSRDKVGLQFSFNDIKTGAGNFQYAHISFDAHHGEYGSSSCYGDMSPELASAVVDALCELREPIVQKAVELLLKKKQKIASGMAAEAEKIAALAKEVIPQ